MTDINENKVNGNGADESTEEELCLTEVVYILDRSGSMYGLKDDTIGGFNGNIEKQKREGGKCIVSTVLFNDHTDIIHDRTAIEDVTPMTCEDYYVGGCTALLDAIGGAIRHISNVHRYIRKEDVPEKTLFVIITDGMENASHKYTYLQVKDMIEKYQNERGWEFMFIGANMDAIAEGGRLGIKRQNAVNYCCDSDGTDVVFGSIGDHIARCRMRAVKKDWADEIRKDYNRRNRKKK